MSRISGYPVAAPPGRPTRRERRRLRREQRNLSAPCCCGHLPDLHRHHPQSESGSGSECAQCGPDVCPGYRRPFKIFTWRTR
jgi:hypothetical protein